MYGVYLISAGVKKYFKNFSKVFPRLGGTGMPVFRQNGGVCNLRMLAG
jgi:hypothetical protein